MAYVTKNREKSYLGNLKNDFFSKEQSLLLYNLCQTDFKKEKKLFNSVRVKIPNFEERAI